MRRTAASHSATGQTKNFTATPSPTRSPGRPRVSLYRHAAATSNATIGVRCETRISPTTSGHSPKTP